MFEVFLCTLHSDVIPYFTNDLSQTLSHENLLVYEMNFSSLHDAVWVLQEEGSCSHAVTIDSSI